MDTSKMNEGVLMLAKRMESDPQEFGEGVKWVPIMTGFPEKYRNVLTPDEINYLDTKLTQAKRDCFTGQVLRTLTGTDNPPRLQEMFNTKAGLPWSQATTLGTITSSNTSINGSLV